MCRPPNINVPSTKDCALLAPAFQCAFHQTLTVPARKECALMAPALECAINERLPYWRLSIRHQLCRQRKNVSSLKDCASLAPALQCAVYQTLTVPSANDCASLTPAFQCTFHHTFTLPPSKHCAIEERLCLPGICVNRLSFPCINILMCRPEHIFCSIGFYLKVRCMKHCQ